MTQYISSNSIGTGRRSGLHAFNQDSRRLRSHDARVGQFAGSELFTEIASADADLLVAFGSTFIHQAHASQLLIVGRESDFYRLNEKLTLELVEFSLGGEAVPNIFAVVIGGVGVLAADNDVGKPKILAIDRVHDRLLRSAVEHFDVQPEEKNVAGEITADFFPQFFVLIALAQRLRVDEGAVSPHARGGIDVVSLGFADQ